MWKERYKDLARVYLVDWKTLEEMAPAGWKTIGDSAAGFVSWDCERVTYLVTLNEKYFTKDNVTVSIRRQGKMIPGIKPD